MGGVDPTAILRGLVGPYGAMLLLLIAVIYLWRKLEATQTLLASSQALLARQLDLFDQALAVIKDDLVPLVREMSRRQAP